MTQFRAPVDLAENTQFRLRILALAAADTALQTALLQQCAEDVEFFFNVFLMTFDPRPRSPEMRHLPFVVWDYQREAIHELIACIEDGKDLHLDKSRDMGATWIILGVFLWYFIFKPSTTIRIASRNEDLVDKSGDPDCLFHKLDYMLAALPAWMMPRNIQRTHLTLANKENGSTINGESTNQNVGRGGRAKVIFLDEFAAMEGQREILSATADASPCRLFVSTPKGEGNEFARLRKNQAIRHLSLHWSRHPHKAAGLYKFVADHKMASGRKLVVIDAKYQFPKGYEFVDCGDDRMRSPWYDGECERRSPREVAQEIDISYNRSGDLFFNSVALANMEAQYGREPTFVGELNFSREGNRIRLRGKGPHEWFRSDRRGRLRIWSLPLPGRLYVVTADISLGQGSSNSAISVGDKHSGEKVASFIDPNLMPHELAEMAKAMAIFYQSYNGDAFCMWEANGAGLIFGKTLLQLGHGYYYCQRQTEDVREKRSNVPGWHSSGINKRILLSEYDIAIMRGAVIIRDREALAEAHNYVNFSDGTVGPTEIEELSSGARQNHGDRVIADALLCMAFKEVGFFKPPSMQPPEGSYAAMKNHRDQRERRRSDEHAWSE